MKKLIAILLSVLMIAAFTACGSDEDLSGIWQDSVSGRATLDLQKTDEGYSAVIQWADSASANVEWSFTCTEEDGTLTYTDAVKKYVTYDEDGNADEKVLYEDGTGSMAVKDSTLIWIDDKEHAGDECAFEKVPQ